MHPSRPSRPCHPGPCRPRAFARGAALIETLVALLIVAFGVLGFIGLQARASVAGAEGQQRALALQLVNDMSQRMAINRSGARAGYYARTDIGVNASCVTPTPPASAGSTFDTAAFNLANADVCAWHAQIRAALGATDGTVSRVRGCIAATGTPGEFQVSLAWQGLQASAPSAVSCGSGDSANFPDERMRRAVGTLVRIGSLS